MSGTAPMPSTTSSSPRSSSRQAIQQQDDPQLAGIQATKPSDWRLFRRIGLAVTIPAGCGMVLMAYSSGWWRVVAALLVSSMVACCIRWIVAPLRQTANRLNKTSSDLNGELVSSAPQMLAHTKTGADELGAAEEGLYVVTTKVRAEIHSLRELVSRLEQSTTLFEGVLETMQEAVLVVDMDQQVLFINSAARGLFEVPRNAELGKLAWESIRSSRLQEIMAQALTTGNLVRGEVDLTRRNRLVEVSAVVLSLAEGPGCLAVAYDVTELRRLEKMRRDFVSNVSHELKTPLTSIQAYADTLLNGGLEDEECSRKFVERIVEQSERLGLLIQDVLKLGKIESDPDSLQIIACDAQAIAISTLNDLKAIAQTRRVEMQYIPPLHGPLRVLADAEGLRTILSNLLSNAINYTPPGGHVVLTLVAEGQGVLFEVRDTGVGIAKEHQIRVFERFYRVDKARSRHVGGTGLGLAISRHLAEAMQGAIALESELGRGSTFRVRLPRAS